MNVERHNGSGGSALMVVLWIVVMLSVLVSSFAIDARIETNIASYYRKRSKAEYLARSGVEVAKMLMDKSTTTKKHVSSDGVYINEVEKWDEEARRLARGQALRGMTTELGEGQIILDIVPEPARRNINNLGSSDPERERNLERILSVGGVTEDTEMWPDLIEPFLDWMDKDKIARLDGAETEDYYSTLAAPYHAKNGPLDTVEELLLIKGFSRQILYGGVVDAEDSSIEGLELTGIGDLLTTYGDGKVNVNAASMRVLMTLPDVDELIAGTIVEEREGAADEANGDDDYSFKSVNDLMMRVPGLNPEVKKYISTDSSIYRVKSVGEVGGVKRVMWCIMKRSGQSLDIVQWREEG